MNVAPPPSPSNSLRRTQLVVTLAVFVTVFATTSRLARLPLRSLIKDSLGLPPERMAEFFALIGLAWYIKPLAGALSDQIPLAGTRRKHYLMLSALGGAATWTLAALVPLRLDYLIATLAAINLMAVLGNSVAGGLIVDAGRKHGATGRLSALRVLAMNTGSLIVGPLGGWLAARAFPLTCASGAVLMILMAVVVSVSLRSDRVDSGTSLARPRAPLRELLAQFTRRRVWAVALFTGALYLTPSTSSVLYYYQRDALGFSDQTIGLLASLNCAGGMLGAFCYFHGSPRFTLRRLIIMGTALCAICSLSYLLYDSLAAALVLEPIAGFCFLLGIMPIHELTARASPREHEAFVFAAILSVGNAAIALSDVIGTRLSATFGLSLHELILVNAGSVLATLVLLPLVPALLLGREEARADPKPEL